MKKILIILVSLGVTVTSCKDKEAEKTVQDLTEGFTLAHYIGKVSVASKGNPKKLVVGMQLEKSDVITTGKSSIAEISINKKGYIRISPGSRVVMTEITSSEEGNITDIGLEKGKVLVGLSKLKKGSRFTVKSKTAVASVRGTTFRVSSDSEKSKVEVVKGVVRVNPVKDGVVVEDTMIDVTRERSVEISVQKVERIAMKQESLEVKNIGVDDLKEISIDIKETKIIEKLAPESKTEAGSALKVIEDSVKVSEENVKDDKSANKLKDEMSKKELAAEKARQEEKLRKERAAEEAKKIARERARKKAELRKKEEARKKAEKLKKERDDRVKNVPNL